MRNYVEKGTNKLANGEYDWWANFVENGAPPKIDEIRGHEKTFEKATQASIDAITKLKKAHGMEGMGVSQRITKDSSKQ